MMELNALDTSKNVEENFLVMLSKHRFWLRIFSATGGHVQVIEDHPQYKLGMKSMVSVIQAFTNHQVTCSYVKEVQLAGTFDTLKVLLQTSHHPSVSNLETLWEEALSGLEREKVKLSMVESTLSKIRSELPDGKLPSDFVQIGNAIQALRERMNSGLISTEILGHEESLWSSLSKFPHLCQLLEEPVHSTVFWNVAKKNLLDESGKSEYREMADGIADEEIRKADQVWQKSLNRDSTIELLELLVSGGLKQYRNSWTSLNEDEGVLMPFVFAMFANNADSAQEILTAETVLGVPIKAKIKEAVQSTCRFAQYEHLVTALKSSLTGFHIDIEQDASFCSAVKSFENLIKNNVRSLTFHEVGTSLKKVTSIAATLSEESVAILAEVGKSSLLIEFIAKIVEEDIRNLIDAVEEVFEQQVKVSTVSGFIEVHQFFQPLLKKKFNNDAQKFFCALESRVRGLSSTDLSTKIQECMENLHSLNSLYQNVTNRGEVTKEIIENIVRNGQFHFKMNLADGEGFEWPEDEMPVVPTDPEWKYKSKNDEVHPCDVKATYTVQEDMKHTKSKAALIDLKSRALLMMNTERKDVSDDWEERRLSLEKFVVCIDLSLEIADLCTSLCHMGHFNYSAFFTEKGPEAVEESLKELKSELVSEHEEWCYMMEACREAHYLMNFVHGNQLQIIHSFFRKDENQETVETILKYIHPDMTTAGLKDFYQRNEMEQSKVDAEDEDIQIPLNQFLERMGKTLEFANMNLVSPSRSTTLKTVSKKITDSVHCGKVHIVALSESSTEVINTILALYQNSTQTLPEANQILFCNKQTRLEELKLLLKRCVTSVDFNKCRHLFCIAHIEMLSSEVHMNFVKQLKLLQGHKNFYLAVVFRGSSQDVLTNELLNLVVDVNPLQPECVKEMFRNVCPDIWTLTSDVPGLGKTEHIKSVAHFSKKKYSVLHVSGPFKKQTVVKRLESLKLTSSNLLHIDIGNVDSLVELDTFIFELAVLGYVSAGTESVYLPTRCVFIEVANTLHNCLRNSLHTAMCFQRRNFKWEGYKSFNISLEVNSPVQVVCQYLKGLEQCYLGKKDIILTGQRTDAPLPRAHCKSLLRKYISFGEDASFATTLSCINVLGDQLKKLSTSTFFRCSQLSAMLGQQEAKTVKTNVVKALLEFSKEFARRSISSCRSMQMSTRNINDASSAEDKSITMAEAAADRVSGMIRWEDENHLMFIFHNQDVNTLSVMYRELSKVPKHIQTLLKSQMKKQLPNFATMKQVELQQMLQKVARAKLHPLSQENLKDMEWYALTPDNLLKMVLVMIRLKANVPVIVMGETGCGKTSLIRYLSQVCATRFHVINLHAGVEEGYIVDRVLAINKGAKTTFSHEVWLFLDEINTCDHLGIINDIVCHHSCLGNRLAPNLFVMAACNPYKLRSESTIFTAGLQEKATTDELSRLVYRVHPLPESMVDFVWDFGHLSNKDEEAYIKRMVKSVDHRCFNEVFNRLFADLLSMSQKFVRDTEDTKSCTSLRDVSRCKKLASWFYNFLEIKKKLEKKRVDGKQIKQRSVILALAHCYHSRFADTKIRGKFRDRMRDCFLRNGIEITEQQILETILEEQKDILDRMALPDGTAKNTALTENVFVILVCILNKIPIFVVGKPGCSKSLSIQIIRSNLRGKDSRNGLFQLLPQLYWVSFQGSESSTSDGIVKVFEKAEEYQFSNRSENVLSVVILDEIGLAEVSKFNPLKVLHSLLEPPGKEGPDVAVVGISNWALDASKMNRAIHLSRPDMGIKELFETGKSICDSFPATDENFGSLLTGENLNKTPLSVVINTELKGIAESYVTYTGKQRYSNFHGLRDYYALVKHISKLLGRTREPELDTDKKMNAVMIGLQRNFGGLPTELPNLIEKFQINFKFLKKENTVPVLSLIEDNIKDKNARHLMIITTGDAVLGKLEQVLNQLGRQTEIIFGSQFEEDQTDDYNYRILSRIILCMEHGLVLVLKGLENVYGSLYDMLNQNYTIVGRKKNCRVALGHYSNPMCYVHDNFRCVVFVEESRLDYSDPPFLNRFEKQNLSFGDILTDEEKVHVKILEKWVHDVSSVPGKHFGPEDIFPVYSKDMIASLIIKSREAHQNCSGGGAINIYQQNLLWIIKPEGVLRLAKTDLPDVEEIQDYFFRLPLQYGLCYFLQNHLKTGQCADEGKMIVIFTNSSIHSKIENEIPDFRYKIENLRKFKSEKQLHKEIEAFWMGQDKDLLVLQCRASEDDAHVLLAKSINGKCRIKHLKSGSSICKHVVFIIHLSRGGKGITIPHLNFLSDWELITLDTIERPRVSVLEMRKCSLLEAIQQRGSLKEDIKELLFWVFTRINYVDSGRKVNSIRTLIENIKSSDEFLELMDENLMATLDNQVGNDQEDWQMEIVCDKHALQTSATLIGALEQHLLDVINEPLAKLIYELERTHSLDSFFIKDDCTAQRRDAWKVLFKKKDCFSVENIPQVAGPECLLCPGCTICLRAPFSSKLFELAEGTKEEFMDSLHEVLGVDIDVEDLPDDVKTGLLRQHQKHKMSKIVLSCQPYRTWKNDYVHDFCTLVAASTLPNLPNERTVMNIQWSLSHSTNIDFEEPSELMTHLHTTWWMYSKLIHAEVQLFEACRLVFDKEGNEIFERLKENKEQTVNFLSKEGIIGEKDTKMEVSEGQNEISLPADGNLETSMSIGLKGNSSAQSVSSTEEYANDINNRMVAFQQLTEDTPFSTHSEMDLGLMQITPLPEDADKDTSQPVEDQGHIQNVRRNSMKAEIYDTNLSPHTKLVHLACFAMLPCKRKLDAISDLELWQQQANTINSIAAQVSVDPPIIHSLRFCSDLVCFILDENIEDMKLVWNLGNLLAEEADLDSEEVCNYLLVLLDTLSSRGKTNTTRILSSYINRCLGYNPGSKISLWLFSLISENRISHIDYVVLKPALHQSLGIELDAASKVILGFLAGYVVDLDKDLVKENSFFESLNHCICSIGGKGLDDYAFPALLVDLFAEFFAVEVDYLSAWKCTSVHNVAIQMLLVADRIIRSSGFGLKHVIATSYLKEFSLQLSEYLEENNFNLEKCEVALQTMNAALTIPEEDRSCSLSNSKKVFFMKAVGKGKARRDLKKMCTKLTECMPCLKAINWSTRKCVNSVDGNLLGIHIPDLIPEVSAVMETQSSEQLQLATRLVQKASSSPQRMIALHYIGFSYFYLKPSHISAVTDTEASLAEFLENAVKENEVKDPNRRLLSCLLGRTQLCLEDLQLHESVSGQRVLQAMVVMHLKILLLSHTTEGIYPFFAMCLVNPDSVTKCFVPGFYGDVSADYGSLRSLCQDRLSLISYHVLGIVLHSCFLGSLALGYAEENKVKNIVLSLKEKIGHGLHEINTEIVDSAYSLTVFRNHWNVVCELLSLGSYEVCLLLQIIFLHTKDLLCTCPLQMKTEDERNWWEVEFNRASSKVVLERESLIAKYLKRLDQVYQVDEQCIEYQCLEVSPIDKIVHEQGIPHWPTLFRMTTTPSLKGLMSEFQLERNRDKFPFLSLVLTSLQQLEVLQYLVPILKWHLCSVANVSYHMKQKDCNSEICDFLKNKDETFVKTFRQFQKAWNELKRKYWGVLLNTDSKVLSMKSIHDQSLLSECLILNEESPVSCVLQVLVDMQNQFLERVETIDQNCKALSFLERKEGVISLPLVPLGQAKERSVVSFAWNNDILKFSQCSLHYGFGQRIIYNFMKTEMEVALKILKNKSKLSCQKPLPRIIFSDELFRSYVTMMKEIGEDIEQEELPADVKEIIIKKKESNSRNVIDLLTHLGILMSLLKKTKGSRDTSLLDYIDEWDCILTRQFPKALLPPPEKPVKLCHIVSLHELLEELNADALLESLDNCYRSNLDPGVEKSLRETLRNSRPVAQVVLKATKRFVHRCLSAGGCDTRQSLFHYMNDSSFWPRGAHGRQLVVGGKVMSVDSIFTEGLMVHHVYNTLKFIEETVNEMKAREEMKSVAETWKSDKDTQRQLIRKKKGKRYSES